MVPRKNAFVASRDNAASKEDIDQARYDFLTAMESYLRELEQLISTQKQGDQQIVGMPDDLKEKISKAAQERGSTEDELVVTILSQNISKYTTKRILSGSTF